MVVASGAGSGCPAVGPGRRHSSRCGKHNRLQLLRWRVCFFKRWSFPFVLAKICEGLKPAWRGASKRARACVWANVHTNECIFFFVCLFVLTPEKDDAQQKYEIVSGMRMSLTFFVLIFSDAGGMFCRSHRDFRASDRPARHQRHHGCSGMQRHSRLQSHRQVPPRLCLLDMHKHASPPPPLRLLRQLRLLGESASDGSSARHRHGDGHPDSFPAISPSSLCVCSFRWDRGGAAVPPSSGGRVSVRQGSLTIGQTWSGDIGDYTCTVTSPAGNDSRTARLEVM